MGSPPPQLGRARVRGRGGCRAWRVTALCLAVGGEDFDALEVEEIHFDEKFPEDTFASREPLPVRGKLLKRKPCSVLRAGVYWSKKSSLLLLWERCVGPKMTETEGGVSTG